MLNKISHSYFENKIKVTVYKMIDPSVKQRIRDQRDDEFDYINFS